MADNNQQDYVSQGNNANNLESDNGWSDYAALVNDQFATRLKAEKQFYQLREEYAKKFEVQRLQMELKTMNLTGKARAQKEQELRQAMKAAEEAAAKHTVEYRDALYKHSSAEIKARMLKDEADILAKKLKSIDEEFTAKKITAQGNAELTKQLEAEQHRLTVEMLQAQADTKKRLNALEESEQVKAFKRIQENSKNLKDDFKGASKLIIQDLGKVDIAAIDKELEERVKQASSEIEELEATYQRMVDEGADDDQLQQIASLLDDKKSEKQQYDTLKMLTATVQQVSNVVSQISQSYNKAFEEAENILTTYQSHIDARLQGSDKNYNGMTDVISSNLSISPFVKTQAVLENMKKAVDEGIAYNIEQRAFLNVISDKIANTFDAFDSNLTRLIRLQQADTTAARLGMEASLTKFFNNMFQDSSYLSGLSDQVSAAILDANSQLDRSASAEFEYIVQKWLGSLASVGMSDSTISNIATGINYLSTGDVTNLSNNNQLQTLFAMSASRAGLEYSDILLNGLNASSTNKLLSSMVEYLKEIAENSDNQVVRSAYGEIFNLSLSDMKAISNLTSGDISNIYSNTLSYTDMGRELNSQFAQVILRTNIAEQMSNLYNNAVFGVAEDMVSNPVTYGMTKLLGFMEDNNIDWNIPFVNAMGFGVDLNASVQDIMRLGMMLPKAFYLFENIMSGLGSAGGLNLNGWNTTEFTQRGSGMTFTTGTILGGTSGTTYISSNSSTDIRNSALTTATNDADEMSKITNKNTQAEVTFTDFYKAVVGEAASAYVVVKDSELHNLFTNMSIESNILRVRDDSIATVGQHIINSLSTIKVKPEGNALAVHIASAADTAKLTHNTVSLASGTTVDINETTLINAVRKALGTNNVANVRNIGDLIDGLSTGNIVVKVVNEFGRPIEVTNSTMGSNMYNNYVI